MTTLTRRRRTYNQPGDAHELNWSCFHKKPYLKSERTKIWLAQAINKHRVAFEFDIWAFAIMPDHVHLVVYPRNPIYDIAKFRAAIKTTVAKKAGRHMRERHGDAENFRFWQVGPGFDRNLVTEDAIRKTLEYIHANPVRAGLAGTECDYDWSSSRQYFGKAAGLLAVDIWPPFGK